MVAQAGTDRKEKIIVERESFEFYMSFFEDPPKYTVFKRSILGIRKPS